jgi:multicomponent Na+:H+ antiporter subunit F
MSAFDIVLVIYGVILALTALSVVYRMVVGPTILDRAVSTDSLVVLVVLAMALYVASSKAAWAGPAMLGLTGLAFIGTVTFARFVAREEPLTRGRRSEHVEPGTTTGPLDAIHPEHDGTDRGPGAQSPANAFGAADADTDAATEVNAFGAVPEDSFGSTVVDASDDDERGFGAEPGSERGFGADDDRGFGSASHAGRGFGEEPIADPVLGAERSSGRDSGTTDGTGESR